MRRIIPIVLAAIGVGAGAQEPQFRYLADLEVRLRDVGISADGKRLIAGDNHGVIWVWDVAKRKVERSIKTTRVTGNIARHFTFSADGKFALVGAEEGEPTRNFRIDPQTLGLWDLDKGVKLRSFDLKNECVFQMALSADGKRAASVSVSEISIGKPNRDEPEGEVILHLALRLWDTSTGKLIRTLAEDANGRFRPTGPPGAVAFSADGKSVVNAYVDRVERGARGTGKWTVRRWDSDAGKDLGSIAMPANPAMAISCIAPSRGGKLLAVGSGAGVTMWDLDPQKFLWTHEEGFEILGKGLTLSYWGVSYLSYSPDGKSIVGSGLTWSPPDYPDSRPKNGFVVLDSATGKMRKSFTPPTELMTTVLFAPDGTSLFGLCPDGVRFWNAESGKEMFTLRPCE